MLHCNSGTALSVARHLRPNKTLLLPNLRGARQRRVGQFRAKIRREGAKAVIRMWNESSPYGSGETLQRAPGHRPTGDQRFLRHGESFGVTQLIHVYRHQRKDRKSSGLFFAATPKIKKLQFQLFLSIFTPDTRHTTKKHPLSPCCKRT